ncbi:tetratricopeptide (TPR) repeat protein [Paraburkholderia bannensis]|uniref:Tetratricopeptide (TPR) repeat protein n=1 Tax=Paraburkholderia bannensis TaxID=765414 RepID=A0A7W9TU43_9BURK|nr:MULTISPECIES: tetratricopeptide repeat protein [Paraburkholderia]MBB3256507.1 tetratricopeptide (TPR) repeat protein [Paraburkholderia sp. WP4_3_2]MBB6101506.1 tetratricopeptide (TPR) repeat protein [Paraburkholderia bannensis]
MKSSSGRAPRAATFAMAALASVAIVLSGARAAHAAPPATTDGTPGADSAIAQHNWATALTELDTRIKSNPRDVQAKFKRATILARLGRDDDAIEAFTELTQTYPELPEPYNNLAALYAKHGHYDEARIALETATKANPSYTLAWENLGDLYLRLASASYRRASTLGHTSGATQQRLADIDKIVNPPAATRAARAAAEAGASATRVGPMLDNPVYQFGGPTGSLAMPPFMAPSN